MKPTAYALIIIGTLLLLNDLRMAYTGHISARAPMRYSSVVYTADSHDNHRDARNLLIYDSIGSELLLGAGLFLLSLVKQQDRLDPFSADFQGNVDIEKASNE